MLEPYNTVLLQICVIFIQDSTINSVPPESWKFFSVQTIS
jgi:hypothetical protein